MSDDFVVNDRRLFSKDGQPNEDEIKSEGGAATTDSQFQKPPAPGPELPPANLASLLIGLASSAFIHFGEAPGGESPGGAPDLPAAKHAIDLLAVLQNKTKGNLSEEEESLLNALLYDLRLKYVQACQRGA